MDAAFGQTAPPGQANLDVPSAAFQAPTPSLRALPVESAAGTSDSAPTSGNSQIGSPTDASTIRKFYTFAVGLRAVYDTNYGTTNSGNSGQYGTSIVASVLLDHEFPEDSITASYTFTGTYFLDETSSSNQAGSDTQSLDLTHTLLAKDTHTFSERTVLSLAEQLTYGVEPDIYDNVGTPFNNGSHLTNQFSSSLTYQYTPRVGFSAGYSNIISRYDDQIVGDDQNSVQQSASGSINYSVAPKVSLSLGGMLDQIEYETADRGYVDFTGFGGAQWQVNPGLSVSGRAGATFFHPEVGEDTIIPYAGLSIGWSPGPRTHLQANYSHEVTPSSQAGAQAQVSDLLSANAMYTFNSKFSANIQASLLMSNVSQTSSDSTAAGVSNDETDYFMGPSLVYHYNSYLDFDTGITYSGNTSDLSDRTYQRLEAYIGIRGTY